ncbi:hypothetical protein [Rhodovulum euryhalinum]|uniref:CRISPR type IV-associated protein Csf1 n=1 Tax=Rhodovulum euryhalinum TaxID=35805 RepID=A0A4R2KIA6_9RHOB|nr:hypothetical protein [Rhodovulum euryhalinum]TCO70256.1 CRISPR type IV-associated protein Csf1 [Rhodovulum euryhalinum]
METTTQFVARVLGIVHEPPLPKKKNSSRYASGKTCWMCGGDTCGKGWPRSAALSGGFTGHDFALAMDSDAICQGCAAVLSGKAWQGMVAQKGTDVKVWGGAGWNNYSHLIAEDGTYIVPKRKDIRRILLDPPYGKWVLAINSSGQKHTVFRAQVAASQTHFPVQFDEMTVWIHADRFRQCLADFEALCDLGFSKDSILSGEYHHAQMLKVGIKEWREAEQKIAPWRTSDPDMITIVHFCALGPSHFEETRKES